MKRLKTRIDEYDKKDLYATFEFMITLETLGIKAASDEASEVEDTIDSFCEYCDQHPDGCDCERDRHREYDWDDFDDR